MKDTGMRVPVVVVVGIQERRRRRRDLRRRYLRDLAKSAQAHSFAGHHTPELPSLKRRLPAYNKQHKTVQISHSRHGLPLFYLSIFDRSTSLRVVVEEGVCVLQVYDHYLESS